MSEFEIKSDILPHPMFSNSSADDDCSSTLSEVSEVLSNITLPSASELSTSDEMLTSCSSSFACLPEDDFGVLKPEMSGISIEIHVISIKYVIYLVASGGGDTSAFSLAMDTAAGCSEVPYFYHKCFCMIIVIGKSNMSQCCSTAGRPAHHK